MCRGLRGRLRVASSEHLDASRDFVTLALDALVQFQHLLLQS
jgi:hypothetical protein